MGHPDALYSIGWYAKNDKNFEKAKEYFEKAVELGSANAYVNLGIMYDEGEGTDEDLNLAFKYYMKAAIKENSNGIMLVGIAYWRGRGINTDKYKALEWLNKAADMDNTSAIFYLGSFYQKGDGHLKKDFLKAEQYFMKGVNLGKKNYNSKIGELYTHPFNENYPKAISYYEIAAENGYSEAELETANLYYSGKGGIAKDYQKAAKYYELYYEKEKKNESYIDNLIDIYIRGGNGIEKDKEKAKYWKNIRRN